MDPFRVVAAYLAIAGCATAGAQHASPAEPGDCTKAAGAMGIMDQCGDGRGDNTHVNDEHNGHVKFRFMLQKRVDAGILRSSGKGGLPQNGEEAHFVREGVQVKIKPYLPHGGAVGRVVLDTRGGFFLVEGCEDTVYRSADVVVHGDKIERSKSRRAIGLIDPSLFVALFTRNDDAQGRNIMRPWLAKLRSSVASVTVRFAICDRDNVLKSEQREFRDMLLLDCHERFSPLTDKVLASMRAYVEHYGGHSMFMKLDDDTFVAWRRLMQIITDKGTMWSYMGAVLRDSPVNRGASFTYYKPYSTSAGDTSLLGMRGPGSILGGGLVRSILDLDLPVDIALHNEDRAVSLWVMTAKQSGTPVDILALPSSASFDLSVPVVQETAWDSGWPLWLDRAPSQSGSWGQFPYVLLHRLSKENVSCLMDVSGDEDAANVDACFSTKVNLSATSTLLVSGYPRSGTTMLYEALAAALGYGFSPKDILRSHALDGTRQDAAHSAAGLPKLFSLFEPCHENDDIRGDAGCPDVLSRLSKCDFRNMHDLFQWNNPHNFFGAHVLSDSFENSSWPPPFSRRLLQDLCDDSSVRLFKTIAFTHDLARDVLPLLAADPDMHVVDIVRDPREIAASWKKHRRFKGTRERIGISEICQQFLKNLGVAHPRIHRVLFEELVSDPLGALSKLVNALGLEATATLHEWISRNFKAECVHPGPFSTCRTNSARMISKWVEILRDTEKAAFATTPACRTISAYYNFAPPGHADATGAPVPEAEEGKSRERTAASGTHVEPLNASKLAWLRIPEAEEGKSQERTAASGTHVEQLNASKLAWLHIPQTGTSFANVLVTWGCPGLTDAGAITREYASQGQIYVPDFMATHSDRCAPGFKLAGGHTPINGEPRSGDWPLDGRSARETGREQAFEWGLHRGHWVAMLRQPEQRILSGFFHGNHDVEGNGHTLKDYSTMVAGCSVKMLNGYMCGQNVSITDAMVATAVHRLEDGFAFIGLQSEWDLSVCLFHAMFGGECNAREFMNVRPGKHYSEKPYDTSSLDGWVDPFDSVVFAHAADRFRMNLAKYDVSPATCALRKCVAVPDAALQDQVFEPKGILLRIGYMRYQAVLRVAGCFLPASVMPPASMMQRSPEDGANLTEQNYFGIPLSSVEGIMIYSGVAMGTVILIVCLTRFWASVAAGRGQSIVEGDDDGFLANMGAVSGLMIPMFFASILLMINEITNVIVLGHRGSPVDLAALSLVYTLYRCCLSCACEGILQVMDALVSQAFGIGNHRLCTQYLQQSRFFTFGALVVVLPIFACSERIFLYLGQEASVAAKTTVPAMLFWVYGLTMRNNVVTFFFLKSLGDLSIIWVGVVSNIVHVSAAIIFAVVLDMGIDGIAIAMVLQASGSYILTHWYLAFVSPVKDQPFVDLMFFTPAALQNVSSFVQLAIPSVFVLSCEKIYWEITTIIIGWLGAVNLAANSSSESLNVFIMKVGSSTAGSATTLVSRALGAGYIRQAKFLTFLGIACMFAVWSTSSIVFLVFSHGVAQVFSTNPEVLAILVTLLHLTGLSGFFKSSQVMAAALLRAMTKHKIVALTQFVVYYLIALPLGYYLAFPRGLGIVGIYHGFLVALTIGAVVLVSIVSAVDFDEITLETQARLEKDAAETREARAAFEASGGSAGGTSWGSIGGGAAS